MCVCGAEEGLWGSFLQYCFVCFCIVVGFNPILYTVMEGMAMPFVRLSLFRQGNVDLTANVSIITVPGTAVAGV